MAEQSSSLVFEQPAFGSELLQDPTEMPPAVAEFQDLVRHNTFTPRVLPFDEVRAHGLDNPNKTITQNCIETVTATIADKPNGRLYTDSDEAAEALHGKTQRSNLSRTSIGETSAHQVFFGTLSGNTGRIRIAIKPFKEGRGPLAAEWVNTMLAKEKGFGAFRSLGFVPTAEGGYMLTERRDDVEPMDNVDWSAVMFDPEANEAMIDDMRKFAPLLGRLHENGGFHGDPQVKNGVLTEDGELEFIDWEAAKFVEQPVWGVNTAGREEQLEKLAFRDMTVLFGSMARSVADKGVGLLENFTPQAQWSYFREIVLTPYIEERLTIAAQNPHNNQDEALMHVGELEAKMEAYILSGELQMGLARTRARINA